MAETKMENTGYCIICRKDNLPLSDEHVIPDSIGGYYHIYTVCKGCNSKLGDNVDIKLLNHTLIQLHRFSKRMKGKTGHIPNPFDVKSTTDAGQSVRVEDKDGVLTPYLLPDIRESVDGTNIQISLDKRDENKIEDIISKKLRKKGITPETHKVVKTLTYHESKPTISSTLSFDLEEYKIGMLKIAYEFAVDSLPNYINDEKAIFISDILHKQNIDMLSSIHFIQDGFSNILEPIFNKLIDFSNKDRHYLFLFECQNNLICFVNLFNILSIGIILSENTSTLKDDFIVGINDLNKREFKKYTSVELCNKTRNSIECEFQYFFQTQIEAESFLVLENNPYFRHYTINNQTPLFYRNGAIAYNDFHEKLLNIKNIKDYFQDGTFIVEYVFDEELYIKCLPSNILVRVTCIKTKNCINIL